MGYPPKDPMRRFARFVSIDRRGCWTWTGNLNHEGYATFWSEEQKNTAAHRWMWARVNGPIPAGLQIDHLCRSRRCVNPDHLEAVTPRENLMRGFTPAAINAAKTECSKGHPLDEINTYTCPRGKRECRTCRREASRRQQLKRVS